MQEYLGIEIGGTKLQIVAGDASGRITRRWRATADRARGGRGICEQIHQGIGEMRAEAEVLAIGVGFGGPIDSITGRIARSHQIEGWEGFELRKWLEQETGLPVVTENDSNCAALAEAITGAGAGHDPVFYFNLGSGVGGGLVVDKRIYHGLPPGEAEFGHLRLDKSGATVESRCSGWAIDQRIRQFAREHPNSALAKTLASHPPGGEASRLGPALEQRIPLAIAIVDALADDLAFALSHAVHLLHPAAIVLGGGLAMLGEPLRGRIAERLPHYLMEVFSPGPPLRLAQLMEDAVPVGAMLLAASTVSH